MGKTTSTPFTEMFAVPQTTLALFSLSSLLGPQGGLEKICILTYGVVEK